MWESFFSALERILAPLIAYFIGKQEGKSYEKIVQLEADNEAKRNADKLEAELAALSDDELRARLNSKWLRSSTD